MDEFLELCKLVPHKAPDKVQRGDDELDATKKDIIKASRAILQYSIYTDYFTAQFRNGSHDSDIISPTSSYPFIGISQISQSSNFIIVFLIDNPDVFADILLTKAESTKIDDLANRLIPPIFSYFSSDEMLTLSTSFFKNIVERNKIEWYRIAPIFIPFFRSVSMFRFVEAATTIFFQRIMIDLSNPKVKDFDYLVPIHSSFFYECVIQSLNLIPHQHLEILRMIKAKIEKNDFVHFLIDDILLPLIKLWLKVSYIEDHPLVIKIFKRLYKKTEEIDSLLDAIDTIRTIFYAPKLYDSERDISIILYFRIFDIIDLATLLYECKVLPSVLSITEFTGINEAFRYVSFWSMAYPKAFADITKSRVYEPLIFTNLKMYNTADQFKHAEVLKRLHRATEFRGDPYIETLNSLKNDQELYDFALKDLTNMLVVQAKNFEKQLSEQLILSTLRSWQKTVRQYRDLILCKRVDFLIGKKKRTDSAFSKKVFSIFDDNIFASHAFLSQLEEVSAKIARKYANEFNNLANCWDKIVKSVVTDGVFEPFGVFLGEQRVCARAVIWESIKEIRGAWNLPLSRRLASITRAMSMLIPLFASSGQGRKVIPIVLQQIRGAVVMPSYIILNSVAMRNTQFVSLMPDDDRRAWVEWESGIIVLLGTNTEVFEEAISLQSRIETEFGGLLVPTAV